MSKKEDYIFRMIAADVAAAPVTAAAAACALAATPEPLRTSEEELGVGGCERENASCCCFCC